MLSCWTSFDLLQVPVGIKILSKIELSIQRLYAVGVDDKVYELYGGTENAVSYVRLGAISDELKFNHKLTDVRCCLNEITEDCTISCTPFTDNRLAAVVQTKDIEYVPASPTYAGPLDMPDIDTQCQPVFFNYPNAKQGWKTFALISWTGGNLTSVSMLLQQTTPINPLTAQANVT